MHLTIFLLVKGAVLRFVSPDQIGSLNQVIPEITIACTRKHFVISLKITRLVAGPEQSSKFCDRGLVVKALNVADFSENPSTAHRAYSRNGLEGIRDSIKNAGNCLIQILDLAFKMPDDLNRTAQDLVNRILHTFRKPVRGPGSFLDGCGQILGIAKAAMAFGLEIHR